MSIDTPQTILLVEDDIFISLSEAKMLQRHGYQVITAPTGEEAIQVVDENPAVSLILMDINLGSGLDGTQAAQIILARHDLPLIFLSSHTEREIVEKTEGITSYGYLTKDSNATVLIASIKMAFRLFDANRREKEKEAALSESQRVAHIGHWAWDTQSNTVTWSDEMKRMWGLDPATFNDDLGAVIARSIHPDDQAKVNASNERVLTEQHPAPLEYRIILPDQSVRTIFAVPGHKVTDSQGSIIKLTGVVQDITERKLAEEELSLHSQILSGMAEGVNLTRTSDGIIVYANPRLEELFGYQAGELLGNHVSILNAPSAKAPGDTASKIMEILRQNGKWSGEIHNIKKDGATFWSRVKISSFKHPRYGEVWISVHEDITDRKRAQELIQKSQEKFAKAFQASPEAIAIAEMQTGKYVEVNDVFVETLGYSREELTGRTSTEIGIWVEPDDRRKYIEQLTRAGRLRGYECRFRMRSGEIRDLLVSSEIIEIEGQPHSINFILDITDRKLADAALAQTAREKQVLLYEIQHRTKNSFAMLSALVNLMVDASLHPEARAVLAEVSSRIISISELYSLLFDTNQFMDVSLDAYADRIIASLPTPSHVHFQCSCQPIIVTAKTAATFGLVFTELVTNAIKYAFPNAHPGRIFVIIQQVSDTVRLVVQDDGIGLPAGFDLQNPKYFGFQIVQSLTRQLGGVFHVESQAGTRCTLEFPLSQ